MLSLLIGFCGGGGDGAGAESDGDGSSSCVSTTLYDISYWLCYLNSPIKLCDTLCSGLGLAEAVLVTSLFAYRLMSPDHSVRVFLSADASVTTVTAVCLLSDFHRMSVVIISSQY